MATTGTDTFNLTVNNVAPVVTAPADQTADEGTSKTFDLGTFTDAGSGDTHVGYVNWGDGGSTRYLGDVTSPDITASATDPANTAHAYADNGTYTVQVWVNDDDGGSTSITFTVTVNNVAPTANDDTSTANEDGPAVTIDLTGNDTDPGSDDLEISSIDLITNSTLGTVTINADNDTVEYDPNGQFENLASGQSTTDTFNYIVSDGDGGTDTGTVTIEITGINDEPTLDDPSDVTIIEDAGAQTVNLTGIDEGASGAEDSQALTITATSDNPLIIPHPTIEYTENSSTGTLSFTPLANKNTKISGPVIITVTVQDNGGTANGGDNSITRTFTVTINAVNDIPVFTVGPNQPVDEDAGAQTVAGFITDIDDGDPEIAQTLAFNVTNDNNTLFSSQPFIDSSGQLTYTPAADANGSATVTVSLTDDDNAGAAGSALTTADQTFLITVNAVNDMPVFTAGADLTVLEDAGAQTIANWATGIDDGDPEVNQDLTFNVTNDNNDLFSSQPAIDASGQLTYTPADNANGSATVTVSLTDNDNAGTAGSALTTADQTFTITVTPVNDEPSFTAGFDQTVIQGAGPQTVSGWATSISAGPANESVQALEFHVSNDNSAIFIDQPAIDSSGTLTFTPSDSTSGIATITVYMTDNGGTANGGDDTTGSQTFTIKVQSAAVIQTSITQYIGPDIDEGESLPPVSFTLTNANSGYEAKNLNYNISNDSGGWLTCSGSGSLTSGSSTTINMTFNTASLTPNTYRAYITITDPDAMNDPVLIYVRVGIVGEISIQVGWDNDDAEERKNGDIKIDSTTLDLGSTGNNNNAIKYVGIRFPNISIPSGSEIKSAEIQFQAYEDMSGGASFNIYGQKTGNTASFNGNNRWDISGRTRTDNSVSWGPSAWEEEDTYDTPDLTNIVQEIVNLSDWNNGNAMAFIINGSGHRAAVSNECQPYWTGGWWGHWVNVDKEPKLTVKYLPGAYSIIDVDKAEFNLWIWEGDNLDSYPETFNIRNTGSGELRFTITDTNDDAIDWISVAPTSIAPDYLEKDDDPEVITVTFPGVDGLTAADPQTEYTGTITISDPEAVNNPVTIDVKLAVLKPKPEIEVSTDYIGDTTYFGYHAANSVFTLTNTGRDVLNYIITTDASWLSCTPSSAVEAGAALAVNDSIEITVDLNDTKDLDVGVHDAYITITDSNAINSPVSIKVSITVEAIPLSTACGDVPVYTENLLSPAILLLLDISGSMDWDIDVLSESHKTPDLKTIVQEIVNRANWVYENNMAFIISGTGHRPAYSYDGATNSAPVLHVKLTNGTEVESQVNLSSDDAEQNYWGDITLNSSDLDLGNSDNMRWVGMRFRDIKIPQGASIESAYITFDVSASDNTATNLLIRGNNVDDAITFENSDNNISGRALTTNSVSWNTATGLTAWIGPTQQPRIEVAQEALKELIKDKTISWGFATWNAGFPSGDLKNYTKINVGCKYWTNAHKTDLETAIDNANPNNGTPLSNALVAGLDYFKGDRAELIDPDGDGIHEKFVGADCQPTFAIVITDGMGNTGTTVTNVGGNTDDLEEYGVNTVGIGFGLALEDTEQLYKLAERSNYHGALNDDDYLFALHKEVKDEDDKPIAQPFLAQSKQDLLDALKSITAGIKAEVFHGSAPAPTTSVDYGDIVITAKFQPTDWSGDLEATQYDDATGMLTDVLWTASEQMPSTIKAYIGNAAGNGWEVYDDDTLANDCYPFICSDKKLGDIIDSTPIIVEDPAFAYYFDNYLRGFKYVVDRDPLVYIGANDGALHAFMLTDTEVDGSTVFGGEEVWRFYPTAVRDSLNEAQTVSNANMCDSDNYCHRYFVDGSPISGDIFDGTDWKTMLVSGLREGGEAYFALDITYGKSFDYSVDTSKRSKFMWEFSDADAGGELGQTWGEPAIARVYVDGSTDTTSWGVFFGSGYKVPTTLNPDAQKNKEAYLFGIEANNETGLWKDSSTTVKKVKISSTELKNDALSSPLVADVDGNNISEAIYVGNLYGSMYRVRGIGKGMEPGITKLLDFGDKNHDNPIRAKAGYGYTATPNVIRVCFGTGIYEEPEHRYPKYPQYFFGLLEDFSVNKTYTISSTDLVQLTAEYETGLINAGTDEEKEITVRTITGGPNDSNLSWVINLDYTSTPLGSERVISQPLVVAGIVFFTTFIPDEDVCEGNGQAHLFAIDSETGMAPTEPVFDINGDGIVNSQDVITTSDGTTIIPAGLGLGSGQPSKPVLHKDTLFITTTGGGLTSLKVKPLALSDMTSWKENNN